MPKVLLTKEELLELDRVLIETYAFFRELRTRSAIARLIHYPSVPSEFSESLTIHCAEYFFGKSWVAKFNGDISDIILEQPGEQRTVEVKSTGQTNFQELKPKDLNADFLVWMHFGDRYISGIGKLSIYILKNPKKYFEKSLRLKLRDFFRYTEGSLDLTIIEAESLQELLNG
ncbi:MAG: hypothetical protein HYR94_25510 [Chloroflexi bacterium]|nr:hypothetical protein [Chloroflexota bacterium]